MTSDQKKMVSAVLMALIVCLIASAYLCGVIQGIASFEPTLNPLVIIARFVVNGFPWGAFLGTFTLLFILLMLMMAHRYAEGSAVDKMGRLFKMAKKTKTYGEAHFEEPEEYSSAAIIQHEPQAVGTILGQLDESGKYPIVFREDKENRLNRHIAIVGASGSGKTFTFSKNYAFQAVKRRESVILTDPDGGLYADIAGYFMDRGYIVRRFDLANLDKSDGWNCMKILTNDLDRAEENAEIFATIVISNITDARTQSIYKDGPKSLLKALLLRVALGHDFKPEEKNISSVYQLLQNPMGEEFLDQMFDPATLTPEEKPCLGPYLSFKQASPNLRGNLLVNLAANLNVLQTQKVRTVLSTECIDLSLPGQKPCAYFCVFPDSHDTYRFIVSLFFSMLFVTLTNDADAKRSRKLDVPVDFLLDEFPSIGIIPDFSRKMATIRKRLMNVCMIFQDITQLRQNYENSWATILANCSTFIDLGINDADTADLVSKRIGDTTVQVETERHNPMETIFNNATIFHQRSTGEGKRALVSFSELFSGMKENDSIIMFQYHNPILAKKYPYTLHSQAKFLRPLYLDEIPSIDDKMGRALYYEEQQRIYDDFMAKHPHINEVDRTYAGMCEPVVVKSVWQEGAEAFRALFKGLTAKEREEGRDAQKGVKKTAAKPEVVAVDCEEVECQIVDDVEYLDADIVESEEPDATVAPDSEEPTAPAPSDSPEAAAAPPEDVKEGLDEPVEPTDNGVPEAVRQAEMRAKDKAVDSPRKGAKKGKGEFQDPEVAALLDSEEEESPSFDARIYGGPKTAPIRPAATTPIPGGPPGKRKSS